MKYPLSLDTWGKEELETLNKVIKKRKFSMGPRVKEFENKFAKFHKFKHSIMVNSGSSANLLILSILKYKYKLKGNIIVPVLGWSTTFFPVEQCGFKLNFVDIDRETLNIDPLKIEKAINSKTVAILVVNVLGNPCNFEKISKIAKKYNLILIEDNCESFGAKTSNGKLTGTIGQFSSFSFFFSHHLQTMEGGMILCKNKHDADYLRSLRAHGWTRDLSKNNKLFKATGDKFKDHFTFITPGYNLRPLEMSGAIGEIQLKKTNKMMKLRLSNGKYFVKKFKNSSRVTIQKELGQSSWFAFAILLKGILRNKRKKIISLLSQNNIETRPIIVGNFMKNPVIKYFDFIAKDSYKNANYVDRNGFYIGNYPKDLRAEIDLVYNILHK